MSAVAEGAITHDRAERLVGRMLFDSAGIDPGTPDTASWRSELLELGVDSQLIDQAQAEMRVVEVRFPEERLDVDPSDVEAVARHLEKLGDAEGWEAPTRYTSIALAVIDAIWSLGVRYQGVVNVVRAYSEIRARSGADAAEDTPADLADTIDALGGPDAFAQAVGNRQRTSARGGVLKAEAVLEAARMLDESGIARPADLSALSREDLRRVRAAWTALHGQRSGLSWNYFLMLLGIPEVKADRMIRRFVADALGRQDESNVAPEEARALVLAAANQQNLDWRGVDYAIWRHQSGRSPV
jgi:hypothetical protein